MVKGIELFQEYFADYAAGYVLIGGAASQLVLAESGLSSRATKDLDIVICAEALDDHFVRAFWQFVSNGGYTARERGSGHREYYRFHKPSDTAYPAMIELFTRRLDGIDVPSNVNLTPIPTASDLSSLSAILLDDTYYAWIMTGKRMTLGISTVGPEHLIALKARAYLDLSAQRERGEHVDLRDIRKHRSDIVRLSQLLSPVPIAEVPASVREDVADFTRRIDMTDADVGNLSSEFRTKSEIVELLGSVYSFLP